MSTQKCRERFEGSRRRKPVGVDGIQRPAGHNLLCASRPVAISIADQMPNFPWASVPPARNRVSAQVLGRQRRFDLGPRLANGCTLPLASLTPYPFQRPRPDIAKAPEFSVRKGCRPLPKLLLFTEGQEVDGMQCWVISPKRPNAPSGDANLAHPVLQTSTATQQPYLGVYAGGPT